MPPFTSSATRHTHWVVDGSMSTVASPSCSGTRTAVGRRTSSPTVTRRVGTRLTYPSSGMPLGSVNRKCIMVIGILLTILWF